MTEPRDGLIEAYLLDRTGGGRRIGWDRIRAWKPEEGIVWIHLDYTDPGGRRWITQQSGVDEIVAETLIAEETRPRSLSIGNGLLICLRGVNNNPGADPEDMVSLRMWIEEHRIITTRKRRLLSIRDLVEEIERGQAPKSAAEFLVFIADRLVDRMSRVIEAIDDAVDEAEESMLMDDRHDLRSVLTGIRREAIILRRYLAPQREAMARILVERVPWLDDLLRTRLRETTDKVTRYIEDLDAARERASVAHEELASRLSETLNRRMYLLSVIAGIFLPLGFLTGLLGINVGGIPGAENPWGFASVIIILGFIILVQMFLFRWKRWF